MATQNIEITSKTWTQLDADFTQGNVYTITCRGAGSCEIAIASSKPDETFLGHIAKADENFSFTYNGDDVWVKCGNPVTIVIS